MRLKIVHQSVDDPPLGAVRVVAEVQEGRGVETADYRRFDAYGLTLVTEGEGIYERPREAAIPIRAGQILVTLPGRPHRFGPHPGETWKEVFVVFAGPLFRFLAEQGALHDNPPVQMWRHGDLKGALLALGDPDLRSEERTARLVALILGNAHARSDPAASGPEWLTMACRYLREMPRESRTAKAAAARCGVGYETFRKRFTQWVGVSPDRYRLQHRLRLAQTLLQRTEMAVKSVAAEAGFDDPLYFSRRYREEFGHWPTEARTSAGGEGEAGPA